MHYRVALVSPRPDAELRFRTDVCHAVSIKCGIKRKVFTHNLKEDRLNQ